MLELGRGPYVESCQRYGVKPNREVLAQLDQPDLMRLQRIDASKTFLGNLGVHAVLDFVHNHQGITEVLLQKNGVDAACAEHFCKTLEEGHPSLEAVDLSDNPISTHTVRLLWETARRQRTLVKVRLDGCGVPDEWIERLQHALNSNAEFQQKGFYPYGPQRDLLTWRTVFILVLGDVEQVRRYAADVLQTIGSYVASMRVRVAPMTLKEGDSMEKVSAQVKRCSEANNHGLTWCTAFIGPNPLTTAQQNALAMVLAEKRPEVEPLRSKLGVLRDPVYRCARNVFVYALDDSKRAEESNVVPAKQWLHSAGFDGEAYRHLVADVGQDACALTPSVFSLRCQSDLIAALGTTFSEDPLRHSQLTLELRQQPENLDELTRTKREAALGALHVKKSAVLFNYLEDHSSAVSVPFILFGAGNLGKGEILSYAADFLRQRQMDGGTTVGDRTSLQAKVVHMSVDLKNRNVVVILYSILRVFAPTSSLEFPSIGALLSAVHQAIANYHGPPITLLISRLDAADTLGQDCNAAVDWLPNSFSGHIKIAISLNTESPILAYMRKRSPQPYVCLILPIGERHRLNLLRRCLSERGIHLSGMEECSIGDGGGEKTAKGADAAYLQKDESTTLLYPRLVAAYIQFVCIQPHGAPQTEADTCDLLERLPDTTSEVIAEMCASLESFHSPITLRYILLCLSFAALPVPELLYICEELGPCEKHSVLPALFQLAELDLVDWSAESMAQLSHETIRGTVSTMYAEHVDHVSVLVENHLYRLVVTRSPEMVNAMLYSLPLLVSNGNFVGASRLLLNTVVMHMILRRKDAAIYVIAAYFRLILAKEVLEELNTVGDMMDVQLDDEALQWAMMEVQRDSQNLFQTVLLKHNLSPFFRSAIEKLESPPLTVLHPTNRGSEDTSVSTWSLEGVCQFLHGRGEYVVASTPDTVSVFCSGSGECVAKISMPFENNQKILGALMATGTRVVVMSAEQLLLWDFVSKSFFFVSELTATPREDALDPFGTILIAVNRATSSLCILDIPRKRTIQDLPDIGASPAKSAQFCGSRVLLLAQCDMYLLDDEHTNPIKLQHDGPIRLVHCNADGRLIASSVGNLLYLWMATGDLVHRVATGSTPLSSLHFTANGSYLLTRQAEGVKVWKTITGTCLSVLPNEFDGEREIGTLRFTEDGSMMFANTGRHILLWDARTSKPVGALSAPAGLFAVVLELGNTIYAATTEGCIKSWSLAAPVPSITQVKAGSLTTNWLKNSKVSTSAITEVATNSTSTIFACLDAQHQLGLFSTQTGKRMQHRMGSARSAVVMGHETVLYIPSGELVIRQHNLVDGSETTRYLPSDTLDEAEVHLFRSEEDGYFGLTYFVHGSSCSLIYHMDEPSMLCRLVGHTGRTLHASFFGSLAYTVGEDCNIRLWNVARCAERATYTHPEPILMAKKDPLSGILTFLDGTGSIYRICVQNISSPTKACFVAVKADLVITSSYLMHHGPRCMAVYGNLAFFIMTDNTLVVANTDKDDVFSTVALTDTVSMELGVLHDQPTLITGHNTGDAISSRVISAEKAK